MLFNWLSYLQVQGEFEHWHKTRVLQYELACAQVATELPTAQQPAAPLVTQHLLRCLLSPLRADRAIIRATNDCH